MAAVLAPSTDGEAAAPDEAMEEDEAAMEEDGQSSCEEEGMGVSIDLAALVEAQRAAGSVGAAAATSAGGPNSGAAGTPGAEQGAKPEKKRKQRGGCKESHKRRKRQKWEGDLQRAKQAGLPVPSLRDALKAASTASKASGSAVGVPTEAAPSLATILASAGTTNSASSAGSVAPAPADREVASLGAASAVGSAAPERRPASYDDAEGPPAQDPRTAAAVARVVKEVGRRAKVAEALSARTVFVTNLSFKVTEQEIRDWLGSCGKIREVLLRKDRTTAKPLGYGHVQFESAASAASAAERCDRFELHGRVMRVALAKSGEKLQFELPEELKEDVRALMREKYEGMNISTIKDAWQKRHPGQKFDTCRFGFKNFSSAMKTIEGVVLEKQLETKNALTDMAFFTDSPAHAAFLVRKEQDRLRRLHAEYDKKLHGEYDYDSCVGPEHHDSRPYQASVVAAVVERAEANSREA